MVAREGVVGEGEASNFKNTHTHTRYNWSRKREEERTKLSSSPRRKEKVGVSAGGSASSEFSSFPTNFEKSNREQVRGSSARRREEDGSFRLTSERRKRDEGGSVE